MLLSPPYCIEDGGHPYQASPSRAGCLRAMHHAINIELTINFEFGINIELTKNFELTINCEFCTNFEFGKIQVETFHKRTSLGQTKKLSHPYK